MSGISETPATRREPAKFTLGVGVKESCRGEDGDDADKLSDKDSVHCNRTEFNFDVGTRFNLGSKKNLAGDSLWQLDLGLGFLPEIRTDPVRANTLPIAFNLVPRRQNGHWGVNFPLRFGPVLQWRDLKHEELNPEHEIWQQQKMAYEQYTEELQKYNEAKADSDLNPGPPPIPVDAPGAEPEAYLTERRQTKYWGFEAQAGVALGYLVNPQHNVQLQFVFNNSARTRFFSDGLQITERHLLGARLTFFGFCNVGVEAGYHLNYIRGQLSHLPEVRANASCTFNLGARIKKVRK